MGLGLDSNTIAAPDPSGPDDVGVGAHARQIAKITEIHRIAAGDRLEEGRILRQAIQGQRWYDTPRTGDGSPKQQLRTDGQGAARPPPGQSQSWGIRSPGSQGFELGPKFPGLSRGTCGENGFTREIHVE